MWNRVKGKASISVNGSRMDPRSKWSNKGQSRASTFRNLHQSDPDLDPVFPGYQTWRTYNCKTVPRIQRARWYKVLCQLGFYNSRDLLDFGRLCCLELDSLLLQLGCCENWLWWLLPSATLLQLWLVSFEFDWGSLLSIHYPRSLLTAWL